MKEELIFDGITGIREDIIERAEEYVFPNEEKRNEAGNVGARNDTTTKKRKVIPTWVTVAVTAACLLLVFSSPFVYMATRKCGSEAPPEASAPGQTQHGSTRPGDAQTGKENPGNVTPEDSIGVNDVWIYFVEDGEICREQRVVKIQAADVFELWKEKNGIGDEVQLLECELRSNATTEQQGEVVSHKQGDYFSLYLTVSKNLEDYYGQKDEALLLTALEQTMTGYSGLMYQEYHLILE